MVLFGKKSLVLTALTLIILLVFSACTLTQKETQKSNVIMGSVVTVKTYGKSEESNLAAQDEALSSISSLEMLISKNDENAALYKLNQLSGDESEADSELFDYLELTKQIYADSEKLTSVTSGALTEAWGIDTEDFRLPTEDEINSAKALCDDNNIIFKRDNHTVKTMKGQLFNLGSVGKGIACDKAVEVLIKNGNIDGGVVSVGGSIGVFGTHGNARGEWNVGVRNPFGNENEYFGTIKTGEACISTSGSYEKQFEINGVKYHHILDLTTGFPVENRLCSVTIVAQSGLISDALSTMCFCLGEERSQPVLKKYDVGAIFVYDDRSVSVTENLADRFVITDNSFSLV